MSVVDTHFIEEFGEILKTGCDQNEPPFCEVACPFHLPVREMEDKWSHGRFNAVYRTYQTATAFPAIVSRICGRPCEDVCIMKNRGGSIQLGAIEEATVRLAKRTRPNAYNLPSKGRTVAVIGGGLTGLGCALRLCNKKYEVTIFEASDALGGDARRRMDAAIFDAEIDNQFREEHPRILLGREVKCGEDFEAICEQYEAVLVATGRDGETFGLQASEGGAFASNRPGVFLCGEAAGAADPIYGLADGLRVSLAIERYLKIGLMNEPVDEPKTRLRIDENRITPMPLVEPAEPAIGYSGEEVAAEISRCRKCSCDVCMRECDLMRIHEKTPNRLYEEAYITVRPSTLANDGRWATRRIASCDQCGLCKHVCPQDIDMGQFLMQSHRGLKDTNAMPWAFHDYWLRDMEFSIQEAGFIWKTGESEKSRFVFFPGCQFAASDPILAQEIAAWFIENAAAPSIWVDCCGAPAVWAAEDEWQEEHVKAMRSTWESLGRPVIVFACPTCRKMFDRYLPDLPGRFLEEMLLEWGIPACDMEMPEEERTLTYAFFDPCAGREYPELAESVREIAHRLGVCAEELPYNRENARCCSYGGQYSIAAPDYAMRVKMERAEESLLPYITSCMNCHDAFASRGKENLHILEMAFGHSDRRRQMPTITERRQNRLAWKRWLMKELCDREMEETEAVVSMLCSKELEKELSGQQILLSDMEEVIAFCEREERGVLHPDGSITGHCRLGHMTYWAVYRPLKDGSYELLKGYAHRMNLEGE